MCEHLSLCMATTVQVSDDTKRLLNQAKDRSGKTYDQIIKELLLERKGIPSSMYGAFKGMSAWSKDDRIAFKYE